MRFCIILIVLVVQYVINVEQRFQHRAGFNRFVEILKKQLGNKENTLLLVCYLLLPLLALSLVSAILYALLAGVGSLILGLIIVWYCIDYDGLKAKTRGDNSVASQQDFFEIALNKVFVLIFWYALLGLVGLVIYCLLDFLLNDSQVSQASSCYQRAQQLSLAMEWVPVRLLGMTFALVGHFAETFKQFLKSLSEGLGNSVALLLDFAQAALGASDNPLAAAFALVDRALVVWLVVLALISIGAWVG